MKKFFISLVIVYIAFMFFQFTVYFLHFLLVNINFFSFISGVLWTTFAFIISMFLNVFWEDLKNEKR